MLTEIALTPQVLNPPGIDPSGWGSQLRALILRLAHFGQQCPLIFSNLNAGRPDDWLSSIRRSLAQHRPTEHRSARDLFDRITREYLVNRPSHGRIRAGASERHWVDEANRSAPQYSIDRIVTTREGEVDCRTVFADVIALHSLDQAPFWSGLSTAMMFGTTIEQQITGLRPLWLHGQTLAVVLPYALEQDNRGRPHGEAHWFFNFAGAAFGRPGGYLTPAIELHISFDGNGADMISQRAGHPAVVAFIAAARAEASLRGHEFSLYVRARSNGSQRFIARRLFAGEETIEDPSAPDIRVRWGIALEHVAHPIDAPNQTPPTFTLLPLSEADRQFRFECRNPSPRLLGPVPVRC
jgi:hypothetical protein